METEIEREIHTALEQKKITPATAEYHRAQCRAEGGLERFAAFVQAAPEVAADALLSNKQPENVANSLFPEERALCGAMGLGEEAYRQAKGEPA